MTSLRQKNILLCSFLTLALYGLHSAKPAEAASPHATSPGYCSTLACYQPITTSVPGVPEPVAVGAPHVQVPRPDHPPLVTYVPTCAGNRPDGNEVLCVGAVSACAGVGEVRSWVYRQLWDPAANAYGRVTRVTAPPAVCLGPGQAAVDPRLAVEAQVRRVWGSFPIPAAGVRTFPDGQTLVGAVTRFRGSADGRLVLPPQVILGFPVTVTVTATRFVWQFGDGSSGQSSVGGDRPEVEHVYRRPGPQQVSLRVFYSGAFTIGGAAKVYQLEGFADVPGLPQPLVAREARTQLEAGAR